ncbi:MAG: iron-containing alcohol dehydrogenase [Bryobacter sp.]|nr:iron-containing alcohol dehydrogenase [Bryobacter sp.]
MRFEFATAARIVFGPGSRTEAVAAARALGSRVLLVTGRARDAWDGPADCVVRIAGEPTIDVVRAAVAEARAAHCDVVVALGGGSSIDAGKAIAALLANPGDVLDYLEVVGRAQPLPDPSLPFIAVPTTAGTGSEVTRNAVLASPEHQVKASLRSPHMLPRLAVVDPELTLDLPPAITAATGLDALTQLIEPFTSLRANPSVDALCREAIPRVARSLERCCTHPADLAARTDMAFASLCGGLALANAGLGAVHGFAAPIGGRFDAPHGAVCAILLAPVMRANASAAPERYAEIARLLTGSPDIQEGIRWVEDLVRRLAIPTLRTYGITPADFPSLIEKARNASSMKANPVALSVESLEEILRSAL